MDALIPATTCFSWPPAGEPELSWPREDRLESGRPRRETWSRIEADANGARTLSSGHWRCEPGRWRIVFGPQQQEVFTVLSGRCRIHDRQGGWQEAGPGDSLHIPAGFEGSFEVLETLCKSYVILE